ncbi:MAG: hypothetical protein PHQ36_06665 [Anaerolineales bacterium]|nr:hypothetical protein [Anaerolineales bacterium]
MKAAIVGLIRGHENIDGYSKLIHRNRLIHRNFNKRFNYPIILFHEGNILPAHQRVISKITPNVLFVDISGKAFIAPPGVQADAGGGRSGIGYKHMCRFYVMQIYEFVKDFEYILRLDDDSFLESPIKYDIFKRMKERDFIYGFVHKEYDYHEQTVATLPAFTLEYIKNKNVKTKCPLTAIDAEYYYSNFTLTQTAFWNTPEVQDYLRAVDESLGIYQFRWGDHVIQTLALKMFGEPEKIHYFQDFRYSHQSHKWSNYGKTYADILDRLWNKLERRFESVYARYLSKRL